MSHSLLSYAWREVAACAEVDPELWFPVRGPAPAAVRICRTCPALASCLLDALTEPDQAWGIRAGVDQDTREPLRAAYAAWRTSVESDRATLREAARTAPSASDREALRALATATATEADALATYVIALALSAPAADLDAARDAYRTAKVTRGWAEWDTDSCTTPAYATSATTDRARLHLLTIAHETAQATAPDPAVPSSLAGAA
ncbi:WhiB family transcriptional regulator [Pseudofrankia sp. DC12]|uniref:WhiB family transcriptional regulator n=1 Tax=Pseudofrankia sp. DC12 TaxID=683315 RepID=UPI000697C71B|nr:WhiB family transcriptional regulator [Pseudofrankia sp. DC12]